MTFDLLEDLDKKLAFKNIIRKKLKLIMTLYYIVLLELENLLLFAASFGEIGVS